MACGDKVLVTSTGCAADANEIEALLAVLKAKGLQAEYLPGIDGSAEALEGLKNAENVLFTVTKGKTQVPDILAAKALAEQAGKTAAGYVML